MSELHLSFPDCSVLTYDKVTQLTAQVRNYPSYDNPESSEKKSFSVMSSCVSLPRFTGNYLDLWLGTQIVAVPEI